MNGYVLVVPKKNLPEYRRMAKKVAKVWLRHGALDYKECVGDDIDSPWGLPFPKLLKLKRNEIVIFSYIVFKSRAHRDRVNAKVMADPDCHDPKYKDKPMPFDMKRMAFGGFKVIVEA